MFLALSPQAVNPEAEETDTVEEFELILFLVCLLQGEGKQRKMARRGDVVP